MRIKLIVSAFLGLFFASGYAHEQALSKQELLEQLAIKEDQLTVLGKKIIDQEALIGLTQQRINEFTMLLKEAQNKKFLEKNPHQKINQSDLDKAYIDELSLFIKSFIEVDKKKEQLIIGSPFFKELLNEEDALFFKFYLTKFAHDSINLKKIIIEWESLSDAIINLYNKLDAIKEL